VRTLRHNEELDAAVTVCFPEDLLHGLIGKWPTVLIVFEDRSVSLAESVRLTLLANGVEAVVLDQASPTTLGPMGSLRVAILNDSDLPRAAALIAELQPPRTAPPPSWWWHKRALVLWGTGFVLVAFVRQLAESASLHTLEFLLTVAGAVAFTAGFVFLFVGYRADRQKTTVQSPTS
jgi:hypothetical protein